MQNELIDSLKHWMDTACTSTKEAKETALQGVIRLLNPYTAIRWIPINEKLPFFSYEWVLVTSRMPKAVRWPIFIARYTPNGWELWGDIINPPKKIHCPTIGDQISELSVYDITHWAQFPLPY